MVQTLYSHRLTIFDVANHSVIAEESCCFGKKDSISVQPFELDNDIDSLASYPFPEIKLENEYNSEPQLGDSILLLNSIMTLVSSPF